jgi:hypothetical protein
LPRDCHEILRRASAPRACRASSAYSSPSAWSTLGRRPKLRPQQSGPLPRPGPPLRHRPSGGQPSRCPFLDSRHVQVPTFVAAHLVLKASMSCGVADRTSRSPNRRRLRCARSISVRTIRFQRYRSLADRRCYS